MVAILSEMYLVLKMTLMVTFCILKCSTKHVKLLFLLTLALVSYFVVSASSFKIKTLESVGGALNEVLEGCVRVTNHTALHPNDVRLTPAHTSGTLQVFHD